MFKNYISVSFQIGGTTENIGCVFARVNGTFTFDDLKEKIVSFIKEKYGETIDKKDITITGVSEISRRLFKRLVK